MKDLKIIFCLIRNLCFILFIEMAGRPRRVEGVPDPVESVSFADIEGIVGTLNGDDNKNTTRWFESLEEFAAMARLTELQKYVYCRRLMRGSVKSVVDTFMGIANYQELKDRVLEEFGADVSKAQIHRSLKNRKKKSSESSKQYYIHMKEIGIGVEPELIVQYVIDGIEDDEMSKVMLYGVRPGPQFNEKLELYDLIRRKKIESNATMSDGLGESKRTNVRFHPYRPRTPYVTGRCFKCNQEGHIARQCTSREKSVTCYNCHEPGHVAPQCPNRQRGTDVTCFNCLQKGHISRNCPEPRKIKRENTVFECSTNDLVKRSKQIEINGLECNALIDTGSDINLMRYDEYKRISSPRIYNENVIQFRGVGGTSARTLGYFFAEVMIDNEMYDVKIHLAEKKDLPVKIIIGHEFLKDVEACFVDNTVTIRKVDHVLPVITIDMNEIELSHITNKESVNEVRNCVLNYKPSNIKKSPIETKIILKDEIPVTSRPRRMAESEQEEVNKQINEWIKNGMLYNDFSE